MKIRISAIGKLKSGPEQDLFTRYLKRARGTAPQLGFPSINLREFPESKNSSAILRKQHEGAVLFPNEDKSSVLMVLDENGKDYSSAKFANLLAKQRDQGNRELIIVVGGPDGLDQQVLSNANYAIRFGAMTWPHQIARILLAEQLYRAMTILAGHPYHRS